MTPGVYGKKKYCTYWIRTGNCDYVQEGCKYLHIIPDEATRLSIGIRDMPRWAKEDLPAPVETQRQKDDHPSMKHDWRRRQEKAASNENSLQNPKKFKPSMPPFLDKPNKANGLQEASRGSTPLNSGGRNLGAVPKANGTPKPVTTLPPKPAQLASKPQSTPGSKSASPADIRINSTTPANLPGAHVGASLGYNVNQTQHPAANGADKNKFYAPDRMPTSSSGFSTPVPTPAGSTSSTVYAPVTYQAPFVQAPVSRSLWAPPKGPWNQPQASQIARPMAQYPIYTGNSNSGAGSKTPTVSSPSALFNHLNLGGSASRPSSAGQHAANLANMNFHDFNTSSSAGVPSPMLQHQAGPSGSAALLGSSHATTGSSGMVNPIVGGIPHRRLFAREGESKYAIAPIKRYSSPGSNNG